MLSGIFSDKAGGCEILMISSQGIEPEGEFYEYRNSIPVRISGVATNERVR